MGDRLSVVLPHLGPTLAGPVARARIDGLASRLPAYSAGCFEVRLTGHTDRVDFHVLVDRRVIRAPAGAETLPGWEAAARFSSAWAAAASPFVPGVVTVILEFDLEGSSPVVPAPSVFCALHPRAGEQVDTVRAVTACLVGHESFPSMSTALDACLAALPPGAGINHVGAMWSRTGSRSVPCVRTNLGGIAPEAIAPLVARLGWQGHAGALGRIVEGLATVVDSIEIGWDVGPQPSSRLGLECFVSDTAERSWPRWPRVLEHVGSLAACDSDKVRSLLEWPGLSRRSQGKPWPKSLRLADAFLAHTAVSVFVRRINHLKVVVDGDRVVEIKAYPLFGHRWMPRPIGR
jgi:hypothetical protein